MSRPLQSKSLVPRLIIGSLVVIGVAYFAKGQLLQARRHKTRAAKVAAVKPAHEKAFRSGANDALLERDTKTYLAKTSPAEFAAAEDCLPVGIRNQSSIKINYLHCSDTALANDGRERTLTSEFEVPASIARRFNFWRRVYSSWSNDQYVLHLADYPEVVIEFYDGSSLGGGPNSRERQITRLAKTQKEHYQKLFLSMHHLRDHADAYTPAMQRLARTMEHIKDPEKYLTAYHSIRLQRGQRTFIASGLTIASKYLPAIESEFAQQGIPVEISRLAFVESSFNLAARSKCGASGVYQLMPDTGREFLIVSPNIDERNDPIKAGRAAAKLLRSYHEMVGSWPLAITAYNHGVGGIRRAMHEVGSAEISDLINEYHGNAFGFASKNFFASYLGVLATVLDSQRLFPKVQTPGKLAFSPMRLNKAMSVRDVSQHYKVSTREIASLNPDLSPTVLRSQANLPRGYVIKLPVRALTAKVARR